MADLAQAGPRLAGALIFIGVVGGTALGGGTRTFHVDILRPASVKWTAQIGLYLYLINLKTAVALAPRNFEAAAQPIDVGFTAQADDVAHHAINAQGLAKLPGLPTRISKKAVIVIPVEPLCMVVA